MGAICRMMSVALIGSLVLAGVAVAAPANGDKTRLVFDHELGSIISPIPAQLEVKDGDVFVIEFKHTDPTRFNYELKGIGGTDVANISLKAGTESVGASNLTDVTVTWRHDRHFPVYQVTVSLREGAATPVTKVAPGVKATQETGGGSDIKLYSYTFPIWIKTIGWDLSFTSGIAFSQLVSDKFFIKTGTDGSKTVQSASSGRDSFRPDIIGLANIRVPENWRVVGSKLGLAFGLGLNTEGDTRYFFGPSWTLGKSFILVGGWAGGKVSALPTGQVLNQAPINGDNTLNSLGSRFATSWFAGISFAFTNKETEFLSALGPAQKVEAPKQESPKPSDIKPPNKNPE